MSSEGPGECPDETAQSERRSRKAKKSKAASSTTKSLDDRLAAFGEAFMGSIEGPPLRTQRRAASLKAAAEPPQSSAKAQPSQLGPKPSKRRRKSRPSEQDVEVAASPSPVQPPSAPGGPPQPSGSSALSAPGASASNRSVAPPRMSAAEKRRFMSGKVCEIRSKGASSAGKGTNGGQSEEDREFRQTLREVLDFVTPKLGKEEQRQYEEAKIRALGGTVEKRNKMPFRLLKIKQKERAEQRRQQLEEEKYLGVSMSANQHRNGREVDKLLKQKKEAIKEKKRRREDGLLRLGMGARESRGMAIIPKSALRARGKQRK